MTDGGERASEHASQVRPTLGGFVRLPARVWREVASVVVALVTALVCGQGVLAVAPWPQAALITGIAAGLLSSRIWSAAVVAAVAYGAGVVLAPPSIIEVYAFTTDAHVRVAAPWLLLAVAVAVLCRAVVARKLVTLKVVAGVAVLIIVANMWLTTFVQGQKSEPMAGWTMPSSFAQLDGGVPPIGWRSDQNFLIQTVVAMRGGTPYYTAAMDSYDSAFPDDPWPRAVYNVRQPTPYAIFSALPNAKAVTGVLLALATALIAFTTLTAWRYVHPAVVLPGVATLAAFCAAPVARLDLFAVDVWAGLLLAAAVVMDVRSRIPGARWRVWVTGSVLLGLLALITRETSVLVVGALMAGTLVAPRDQRTLRLALWGSAVAVGIVAYAIHYQAVAPLLVPGGIPGGLTTGDLSYVLLGLNYNSHYLGPTWIVIVLVVLGLLALLELPGRGSRAVTGGVTGLLLLAFALLANRATNTVTGVRINYWGALVLPVLYVVIPFAFALVPGVRARRSQDAR